MTRMTRNGRMTALHRCRAAQRAWIDGNGRPGRHLPREPFLGSRFPIPDSRRTIRPFRPHPRHRSPDQAAAPNPTGAKCPPRAFRARRCRGIRVAPDGGNESSPLQVRPSGCVVRAGRLLRRAGVRRKVRW